MNELFKPAPGKFRRKQSRHIVLRSVRLDLPPDVAMAIGLIAQKSGIAADALIIDILRDNLGSAVFAQHKIPSREDAA